MRTWILGLLVLVLIAPVQAGEEKQEPPASYTAAELSALDRALHAANLTRKDLTFGKDLAKGHACLPIVKQMLHDPLTIAPQMDSFVAEARALDKLVEMPLGALVVAHDRSWDPDRNWGDLTARRRGARFLRESLEAGRKTYTLRVVKPADLLSGLTRMLDDGRAPLIFVPPAAHAEHDDPRYRVLRRYLPETLAWHDVFESPYDENIDAELAKLVEEKGDAYVHELAASLGPDQGVPLWLFTFRDPVAWLGKLPESVFPKDKPLIKETPYGRVAIGTPGDDVYTGDFAALIDPGGNDRYVGCRIGAAYGTKNRRIGFFADLGGDDLYDCGEVNITLGAAVLGVAAFLDLGAGNDRYRGGHCSLGAAMGGCAVFYDDGGTDTYEGRTFTQGAAGFGVGVFHDDSVQDAPKLTADEGTQDPVDIRLFDNDRLTAWANAQAFARCQGVALCINTRGNDTYEAGGVYLHAPLFADRYQSFSQGFAIGERGIDYAGGIAMLIDHAGNDRYLGDIYNQGVGYWYAAGLLYDGGGNDLYEMTQYGQGSGIHLAVGGLVDVAGSDTYVMHSGLGQGGSHDYAASILHDRGGNDRYLGMTSCNGCGLTNSVGLFIDRSGNDTYAGRKGSLNSGRPARGSASVGVFLDLQGKDHYLGVMQDASAWRHTDLGVGVDIEPPPAQPTKTTPAAGAKPDEGTVEIPKVCDYEGELTQPVFDELWAIAIRWQVGENRRIVPKARERLVAFGVPVLPYLDRAMDKGASGLELRAYVDVLRGVLKADAEKDVLALLRRNLGKVTERRRRLALYLVGELKMKALEQEVASLLRGADDPIPRRAAGVLAKIESHAGDDVLTAWLKEPQDELQVMAALGTLLGLRREVYPAVRPLLSHPLISVRSRLATLLGAQHATYGVLVVEDLAATDLSTRAVRTLLDVLARSKAAPAEATRVAVAKLLDHEDWGLRADAARVLRGQLKHEQLGASEAAAIRDLLSKRAALEKDPYVRFWLADR